MRRIFVIFIVSLLMISCAPMLIAQWTSDPAENTAITTMIGEQALPKIAVDSNGFAYISWFSFEASNYNLRLQRLDRDGNTLWPENGVLVSSEPQDSWLTDYDLAVDPLGYALVTFGDIRTGFSNPVGYRISPDGNMMWGETGILLANDTNFDPSPKVCSTTLGNSIFAWQSCPDTGDYLVKLQKISPEGELLWGDNGITLSQSGVDLTAPYLMQAEDDYIYLIWHTQTGPYYAPNRGLYVQKLDADGNFMWGSNAEIYAPIVSGPVVYLKMCRDGAGGIIFSWYRAYDGIHFHCYVQRMDADGNICMATNGVLASTSTNRNHMYPVTAFLSQTQEIVLFFSEQDLNQNMRGIYAQKLDIQGNRLWGDEGIQLKSLSNNDYLLFNADGKDNNAICIYQAAEFGNYVDTKMQAVMLDDQGNFVWDSQFIDMCTVQSHKLHNVMSSYYMGQWVTVWEDLRNGEADIYAQNIQTDGSLGVVVHNPPDKPNKPAGTVEGKINVPYTYTTHTTDPDGDQVYYIWDWGDGTQSEWLGPYNSGETINATHKWTVKGSYEIKVKAKDTFGEESDWSDPLSVSMPRTIGFKSLLLELLERFPNLFQILQYLMGLY